jgi:hypothetical protein
MKKNYFARVNAERYIFIYRMRAFENDFRDNTKRMFDRFDNGRIVDLIVALKWPHFDWWL